VLVHATISYNQAILARVNNGLEAAELAKHIRTWDRDLTLPEPVGICGLGKQLS
jgi:hypothetical protein